jgi:hypothetical protein
VWSQATSRAAAGGMHDSSLEERRVLLPAEVHDYKELYFQLMRRVARFTNELSSSSSSSSSPPSEEELRTDISDFQSLCELLYRGHQAWHLAHIVIKHLVPQPRGRSSDLPFDLVHWVQEHDPLDLYTDVKLQTRCTPFDQGSQQPSQEWWTVLYRYAMHCWVDQACDMIQELIDEHPGRLDGGVHEALVAAQAILEGLTVSEDAADMAQPVEVAMREWSSMEEWHIVESWSVGGGLLAKELGVLMRIMRGSMDDITAHAKTWVQSVTAQMMYRRSDNKLGVADLANVVEDVLVQWGDSGGTTPGGEDHESVIKALMRLDMQAAVQVPFPSLKKINSIHLLVPTSRCIAKQDRMENQSTWSMIRPRHNEAIFFLHLLARSFQTDSNRIESNQIKSNSPSAAAASMLPTAERMFLSLYLRARARLAVLLYMSARLVVSGPLGRHFIQGQLPALFPAVCERPEALFDSVLHRPAAVEQRLVADCERIC